MTGTINALFGLINVRQPKNPIPHNQKPLLTTSPDRLHNSLQRPRLPRSIQLPILLPRPHHPANLQAPSFQAREREIPFRTMDARKLGLACQSVRGWIWADHGGLHVLPTFCPG
jgi:hypothetical protein